MSEPTKLSLVCAEESIEITDKDGVDKIFTICEMTGRQLEQYLNGSRGKVIMTDGKVTGMKTYDGLYSNLLSKTMRDESGKLVLMDELQVWPVRVQRFLYEKAQKVNGLDEQAEDDSKNE